MRDLASVVTVATKQKMFEKDRICCVGFEELGYEAIVPNTVNVGDKMVFIQEGSILPEEEKWEFLRKRCYNETEKGFIIKPMTMGAKDYNGEKGERVKSWGLCVTLAEAGLSENLKAGTDVTDDLKIRKYEPAEDASPKKNEQKFPKWVKFCYKHTLTRWIGKLYAAKHQKHSGGFPTDLISKSDETTIQNCKSFLERFKNSDVIITAKMEGQSFTVVPVFKKNKIVDAYVCSRNNAYHEHDDSIFWKMMDKYQVVETMKRCFKLTGKAYIIQGEQVGPSIQQNIYNFKENHWYVFTVKDFFSGKQLSYKEQTKVADMFNMRVVPIVKLGKLSEIMPNIDAAVKFAEKVVWAPLKSKIHSFIIDENTKGELWEDYFQHEGVVVRTNNYDKDNQIGCSFKVKNLQYAEYGLGKIAEKCKEFKRRS